MLKCSNVVSTVTSHESDISKDPETRENVLLLNRGYASIDLTILVRIIPAKRELKLFHSCISNADVVLFEERCVYGLAGIGWDNLAFIEGAPNEI